MAALPSTCMPPLPEPFVASWPGAWRQPFCVMTWDSGPSTASTVSMIGLGSNSWSQHGSRWNSVRKFWLPFSCSLLLALPTSVPWGV